MTAKNIAARIEQLRAEIRRHDGLYYVQATPVISDREYDILFDELRQLEREHPELVTDDSPTQRVGEQPIDGFRHVTHALPMLSIDNTYDESQLREFDARVARGLHGETYQYVVDPKIDGVAVSLRYESGRLVVAATRGDGIAGDDVTHSTRTIRAIPLALDGKNVPKTVEARGEIYWPRRAFDRYNRERQAEGQPVFANPRNATAGTLKQLDPRKIAGRGLSFIAHGFGQMDPQPFQRFRDLLDAFTEWGIPTSADRHVCQTIDDVLAVIHEWDQKRKTLPYETDGMVIKIDRLAQRDALGATSRYPRWCIAYKFAAEQAESTLLQVDYQVGKLGTITPRAVMKPVLISGTTVQHASLHNFDQVERLGQEHGGLHIGDVVIIEKAGEIIPQVIRIARAGQPRGQRVKPPSKCPICKGKVVQDDGGVYLRCINPACDAQIKERLKFFCGRNQMDIDGLGHVIIERLVDKGLVRSFADLYDLKNKRDELSNIEIEQQRTVKGQAKTLLVPFGDKRAATVIAGIERSKTQPLSRVLAALNIRNVGAATAELLANHFSTMENISNASADDLQEIEGIGPEVARFIRTFFTSEDGERVWKDLQEKARVNMTQPKQAASADQPLAGKTVVVTGTLQGFTRSEIQARIKALGGKVGGSVSKKTDLVVVGESAGSKAEKARQLNIPTVDEQTFVKQFS